MIPFYIPPKLSEIQIGHIMCEVARVMRSGQITNGKNVRQLEETVKEMHKVNHVIACSSATQAMWITLRALKTKSLLVQAFTWKSLQYIMPSKVSYCDIDLDTWLMNQTGNNSAHTMILTHTFGNIKVAEACQQRIIYDGAYSLGAELPEIGDATVISLTATKTVTSCEGGLILTNDSNLATEAREMRDKCSRMSEVNAVVGNEYLKMLPEVLNKKRRIFEYYNSHLPFKSQKTSPYGTNYGFYGCLVPDRDALMEKVKGKIDVRIRYEPLQSGFPVTDEIARHIVVLPCYPDLDPSQVVEIIKEEMNYGSG